MIKEANYVGSYVALAKCPKGDKPEYAFIGRSNVGKSSLINMLCGRKALARVSNTPGKTQTLNFYDIDDTWFVVDLPGYGYARVAKTQREQFGSMISLYVRRREILQCTFVLIDSNIPPQKIDLEFIGKLGEWGIPFACVFTKADRISKKQVIENVEKFKEALLKTWDALPVMFVTSAEKGTGREEVIEYIENINEGYFNHL